MLSLLAALALAAAAPAFAQDPGQPQIAPQNQEFLDYVDGPRFTAQDVTDFVPGLVPEPFVIPQTTAPEPFTVAALPAAFDLRTQDKLTPIRDQGSAGACWAFASIGSMESFLMPGESWNFSENNLKNTHGFDIAPDAGGNRAMSTAYFARWSGPVNEADDPYNPTSGVSPTGLTPVKHVEDVIFIPTRTGALDNDSIKQAVMTYGAVYTTYYHSNSYYNPTTAGYYFNGAASPNHAVCIVGWDDNYSASKFLTPPPGGGAFLIRNSWGTYWGLAGYFWMSYHDSRLGMTENAVFTAEPVNNYKTVYQYDPLGWVSSMGYGGTTAWFANVFTATSGDPITAASWYCPTPNSTYEVYVYTNPTSGPISSSGPVSYSLGTIATAGYHTVKLDAPAPVASGQKFSIVVKLTTPGYGYPIAIERPYSGYSSKAAASPGQSYVSSSGASWSDITAGYANANVCLKAFAYGSTTPTPGSLSVTPAAGLVSTGAQGGPFSPAGQVYTLTNTGQTEINWTASTTQPWLTLSAAGGNLAGGASVIITASINSTATGLPAGSYAGAVTFTNATNGAGNTSRSVSLTVTPGGVQPGTYHIVSDTFGWIDPTYHAKLSLGDNTTSAAISLPFSFNFYGKSYNKLYVGSNGLMGFAPYGLSYYTNTNIPIVYVPNAAIYPYWDDLNPARGGGVYVGVEGTAPNRKIVVSWVDVPWGTSVPLTVRFSFQAILMEGSNDMIFQYLNVSPTNTTYGAGRSATIGIENETGTLACKYSYMKYGAVSNNMAILITDK